ncbi:MAG: hypothetical protein MK135_10545, partial [Polyangiaceae bacterium]|nr:hypothetical protein [Polyangiaceae bacterium]
MTRGCQPAENKYLGRYAVIPPQYWPSIGEKWGRIFPEPFLSACVIPVSDEPTDCLRWILPSLSGERRRLLVFVVNGRASSSTEALGRNRDFCEILREGAEEECLAPTISVLRRREWGAGAVVLINRSTPQTFFAEHQGVGLARRWGLDLVYGLWSFGYLAQEYVLSSDADAELSSARWRAIEEEDSSCSALLFQWQHYDSFAAGTEEQKRPRLPLPMVHLEIAFRYYTLGLEFARSPFAFHALGSAFAASMEDYAKVRGMPDRQAGEDFHFLAKLSQVRALKMAMDPVVRILCRESDRVPFGTGPRFSEAVASQDLQVESPWCFFALRSCFKHLEERLLALDLRRPGGEASDSGQESERATCLRPAEDQVLEEGTKACLQKAENYGREQAAMIWSRRASLLKGLPSHQHARRRLYEFFDALQVRRWLNQASLHFHSVSVRELPQFCGQP